MNWRHKDFQSSALPTELSSQTTANIDRNAVNRPKPTPSTHTRLRIPASLPPRTGANSATGCPCAASIKGKTASGESLPSRLIRKRRPDFQAIGNGDRPLQRRPGYPQEEGRGHGKTRELQPGILEEEVWNIGNQRDQELVID